MRILDKNFENKEVKYENLLKYGFVKKDDLYVYENKIYDDNFKIVVEISNDKKISKIIDLQTNSEYILVDVKNSAGEFLSKLKKEYDDVLNDITKKCTIKNVFKGKQEKEIISYAKKKYNDDLEFLWDKFPNNAVLRNKINNKWYAAILTINENKLVANTDNLITIIDLRCDNKKINEIVDSKNIFKGYHMNKNNWITIKLDGSVSTRKICNMIDESYKISLTK